MHPPETAPYIGPAIGWVINAVIWLQGGMSPLAAVGAVAALWWTIERALTERAKRRVLAGLEDDSKGSLASRLRKALKTEPGDL
jgi:hypothetical protein